MFDKRNFNKAMTWILHFDLRIHFSLDEVCINFWLCIHVLHLTFSLYRF